MKDVFPASHQVPDDDSSLAVVTWVAEVDRSWADNPADGRSHSWYSAFR